MNTTRNIVVAAIGVGIAVAAASGAYAGSALINGANLKTGSVAERALAPAVRTKLDKPVIRWVAPPAPTIKTVTSIDAVAAGADQLAYVPCPAGYTATGGGFSAWSQGVAIEASQPYSGAALGTTGTAPLGWRVDVLNNTASATWVQVWAVCEAS